MKYECLVRNKQLSFRIDLTDMTESDVMQCITDLSFLKKLSIFLYEEKQNEEVKYCSDTLLFDFLNNELLSTVTRKYRIPNRGCFTHINKINDTIVELKINLRNFNAKELCEKISNENSNLLKTFSNQYCPYLTVYLNMDPIFSDQDNLISFERNGSLQDIYMFTYCYGCNTITKEAFEELLKYKKENNKKEYLLLKIIEETLK